MPMFVSSFKFNPDWNICHRVPPKSAGKTYYFAPAVSAGKFVTGTSLKQGEMCVRGTAHNVVNLLSAVISRAFIM